MKVTLNIPKPSNSTWTVKGKDIPELFKNLQKHKWWGRYRSNEVFKTKKRNKEKLIEEIIISGKPLIIMPKWARYSKATKEEKNLGTRCGKPSKRMKWTTTKNSRIMPRL